MISNTIYNAVVLMISNTRPLMFLSCFYTFVKIQFNTTIKAIHPEYGGDFSLFTKYLDELGISYRLVYPRISHQNGTIKCKHGHTVDMSLTLLSHASMPLEFWDHNLLLMFMSLTGY